MREVTYNPLWKKLIDLKMTKAELAKKAEISRSTIAKMRKDEPVNLDVIVKICQALDCPIYDVAEVVPSDPASQSSPASQPPPSHPEDEENKKADKK